MRSDSFSPDVSQGSFGEPIAIIGMGCRFPGAPNKESFWRLLCNGVDAITEVPRDRFDLNDYDPDPEAPWKSAARYGGFLEGLDRFDAAFFGISPREADAMDPAQRLLLEVAWEALEDAGLSLDAMPRSRTGVFVGMMTNDYEDRMFAEMNTLGLWALSGGGRYGASGRLSYCLGLEGPSLTVDTACSSSAVAAHLACRSLRTGECDIALAAGAHIILQPQINVCLAEVKLISQDGRCKFGDARADGFARSEGVGIVVLKRLSEALAAKDPIYAVILGSAINSCGHSSNVFVTPSREAQETVMRSALQDAGVRAGEIQYVEAHGTGTEMGDVVEIQSLGSALAEGNSRQEPCVVGSVKTNIGHAEGASGIAGLIKLALCLRYREIPPSLHFLEPNPKINWLEIPLSIPTRLQPWPAAPGPARAGLNSFGLTGTNAHLVVGEAPPHASTRPGSAGLSATKVEGTSQSEIFLLSAADKEALRDRAYSLVQHLDKMPDLRLGDLCYTASCRRAHLSHRLAVVCRNKQDLHDRLEEYLEKGEGPGFSSATVLPEDARKIAFVFTAESAGSIRLGLRTLSAQSAFRRSLEECRVLLEPHRECSQLDDARALFAFQVSLAAMYRSWGIEPDAFLGIGIGGIVATHLAGRLSLEDACKMACSLRSQDSLDDVVLFERGKPQAGQAPAGPSAIRRWKPPESASGLERLKEEGYRILLEFGASAILAGAISERPAGNGFTGTVLSACDLETVDLASCLRSLGRLHTQGWTVQWHALYPDGRQCVPLPDYPWQRERFWLKSQHGRRSPMLRSRPQAGSGHPHLRSRIEIAPDALVWEMEIGIGGCGEYEDHRILGAAVLPGAAMLEMAISAGRETLAAENVVLERVSFTRLLELPAEGTRRVQLRLSKEAAGRATFDFFTLDAEGGADRPRWLQHAHGTMVVRSLPHGGSSDRQVSGGLKGIQARCNRRIPAEEHYTALRMAGLQYGPRCRGIGELWRCEGEILGRLQEPDSASWWGNGYLVQPGLLDACFQVLTAAAVPADGAGQDLRAYLPVELSRLEVYDCPARDDVLWSYVRFRKNTTPGLIHGDLVLCGDDGRLLVEAHGLSLRALRGGSREHTSDKETADDLLYTIQWHQKPALPERTASERTVQGLHWLILSDAREGIGQRLADALRARGDTCAIAFVGQTYRQDSKAFFQIDPSQPEDFRRLLNDAAAEGSVQFHGVVHLWSLDLDSPETTTRDTLEAAQDPGCHSLLHLTQAVAGAGFRNNPHLWIVTCSSQAVLAEDAQIMVGASPLWGLARVMALEHSELRPTLIDLGPSDTSEVIADLICELDSEDEENQIALRRGERYVARLERYGSSEAKACELQVRAGDTPFRLEVPESGILDNLCLHADERQSPGPGELEIEVVAAGLNFRDVMSALGIYPVADLGDAVEIGVECAGRITGIGASVQGFEIGDEAVALGRSCFKSFARVPAVLAMRKPSNLSFEQAAAIPVAFMTAYHSLFTLARLIRGERVLIHSASGGVGLAAIQLAQEVGAEIFATAGSAEKREYLHSIGVPHVMDSRASTFAEEILEVTQGRGVDVVLNSLSGEAIGRSLEALAPYGRFIEIGRRDIYDNRAVGLYPFRKNLSYFAVDLGRMMVERPDTCRALLRTVMRQAANRDLRTLPLKVFPVSQVTDAFRLMAQARHIGKIVIGMQDQGASIRQERRAVSSLRSDASYLITGGLGGLGLKVAEWMVGNGARHLILAGRSEPSPSSLEVIGNLEKTGAHVTVARADIGLEEQAARMLEQAAREAPPLRGIVHAAGVLDDGLLLRQERARFRAVMAPKIAGAWNLHAMTLDRDLDFFVLFSSISSLLGTPGQGNYAAANAFLDALAHHRHSRGLPATSINWGPWAEVGLAAAQANRGERLTSRGLQSMSPEQGLAALQRLLSTPAVQAGVALFSLDQWCQFYPKAARLPIFELLRGESSVSRPASSFLQSLLAAEPSARPSLLESFLKKEIGQVLGVPASRIGLQARLYAIGLDSLLALELANRLDAHLGLKLPTTAIWNYPTIEALAGYVAPKLGISPQIAATEPASGVRSTELTSKDEEAFADLIARLEKLEGNAEGESPDEANSL